MDKTRRYIFYNDPNYYEYLVEYRGDFKGQIEKINYACGKIINENYAIVSVRNGMKDKLLSDVPAILFIDFRSMFVLNDDVDGVTGESTSNISQVKNNPYLFLNGSGVIVGIIDTGIDYLNSEFIKADGTTRIEVIWDQTINSVEDKEEIFAGVIYKESDINNAIKVNISGGDPYSIVQTKDTIGHGTQLAGIIGACGNNLQLKGIANDCSFVVVKLKESPSLKKELNENNINVPVYNRAEIVAAIEFVKNYSRDVNKPLVILLGLGTTDYSHDGNELLARYINQLSSYAGIVLVTGTGNEGIADGHSSGYINQINDTNKSELLINTFMKNFKFKIWVRNSNIMSLKVTSPAGQSTDFIEARRYQTEKINFVKENCSLEVTYYLPYNLTGLETIELEFKDIKPGIWKFELRGDYITDGRYDMWLPPFKTLPKGTKFLNPDPNNTLMLSSDSKKIISVAYYNQNNNSVVNQSSRGYPLNDYPKPDIAAPGINILTTNTGNTTAIVSGASMAAAIVAGVCALLFQWGIVNKNDKTMFSTKIINYLIAGATKEDGELFPSVEWGYGRLDLAATFDVLSGMRNKDIIKYREYYIGDLFVRIPFYLGEQLYD